MSRFMGKAIVVAVLFATAGQGRSWAAEADEEIAQLKKQLAEIQARLKTLEEEREKEKKAAPVQAGYGKVKFNGLAQNWFQGNVHGNDTYRLRRMELKFSGEINEQMKWAVMLDPAKRLSLNTTTTPVATPTGGVASVLNSASVNDRGAILQDAFVTYTVNPHLQFDLGQEKIPLSLEGLQSSASLETIERTLFITGPRAGSTPGYGDVRDVGLQVKGKYDPVEFQLALLNGVGDGQNATDTNDLCDFVGRIVAHPPSVPGLQFGLSAAQSAGFGPAELSRDRFGLEALYQKDPYTLKAEYMKGKDEAAAGGVEYDRSGWYGHLGYKFNPKWEGIIRVDTWDPDDDVNEERDLVLGVNHFIEGNKAKLQFNLLRKNYEHQKDTSWVLFNAQTSW